MYITLPCATFRCPLKDDNEDKGKDIFHGTQLIQILVDHL